MANCNPPVCSSTYDDSCEAIDCLFNVEALNIDKLFQRTQELADVAETQALLIQNLESIIFDLNARVVELEQA